jgi:hypothetical protein
MNQLVDMRRLVLMFLLMLAIPSLCVGQDRDIAEGSSSGSRDPTFPNVQVDRGGGC